MKMLQHRRPLDARLLALGGTVSCSAAEYLSRWLRMIERSTWTPRSSVPARAPIKRAGRQVRRG
jgi:hypothetical protein